MGRTDGLYKCVIRRNAVYTSSYNIRNVDDLVVKSSSKAWLSQCNPTSGCQKVPVLFSLAKHRQKAIWSYQRASNTAAREIQGYYSPFCFTSLTLNRCQFYELVTTSALYRVHKYQVTELLYAAADGSSSPVYLYV